MEGQKRVTSPRGEAYYIQKRIGSGTYGVVHDAQDALRHGVAVKETKKNGDALRRAKTEASILRQLIHPNIISLFDEFEDDDCHYIVMELAKDGDLLQFLRRQDGPLPERVARGIFSQIVSAVDYAHGRRFIHRDLKLENFLLVDGVRVVKLGDWGFGGHWYPGSKQNSSLGSLYYASPEICGGKPYVGPEVDCWSLGVVLYALVTGKLPFLGNNEADVADLIFAARYPVPSRVSGECRGLIASLLRVDPEARADISAVIRHPWLSREEEVTKPRKRLSAPPACRVETWNFDSRERRSASLRKTHEEVAKQ